MSFLMQPRVLQKRYQKNVAVQSFADEQKSSSIYSHALSIQWQFKSSFNHSPCKRIPLISRIQANEKSQNNLTLWQKDWVQFRPYVLFRRLFEYWGLQRSWWRPATCRCLSLPMRGCTSNLHLGFPRSTEAGISPLQRPTIEQIANTTDIRKNIFSWPNDERK